MHQLEKLLGKFLMELLEKLPVELPGNFPEELLDLVAFS